jgi:hypothetical protein
VLLGGDAGLRQAGRGGRDEALEPAEHPADRVPVGSLLKLRTSRDLRGFLAALYGALPAPALTLTPPNPRARLWPRRRAESAAGPNAPARSEPKRHSLSPYQ